MCSEQWPQKCQCDSACPNKQNSYKSAKFSLRRKRQLGYKSSLCMCCMFLYFTAVQVNPTESTDTQVTSAVKVFDGTSSTEGRDIVNSMFHRGLQNEEDHDEHNHDHDEVHDEDHVDHEDDHGDDHGEEHHDEHGEEDHDEHGDENHDEHGDENHDEHGDEHHDDHHDEHHDDHGSKGPNFHDDPNVKRPWNAVFWSTLLVNLTALTGVVCLGPVAMKNTNFMKTMMVNKETHKRRIFDIAVPGFAAGALFTTACLLILPETVEFFKKAAEAEIEEDATNENDHDHADDELWEFIQLRFGLSLLIGYFIPVFFGAIFPSHTHHLTHGNLELERTNLDVVENSTEPINKSKEPIEDVKAGSDAVGADTGIAVGSEENPVTKEDTTPTKKQINNKLLSSILIGDGFHNFADGIFIGIGFVLCSTRTAMAIMISTIYHELAQELADYFLLTEHGGLTMTQALLFNFISGLTVTLGGFVILAVPLSWNSIGLILGLSAGVYIHISGSECLPRMEKGIHSINDRFLGILCLFLGGVPIGLVTLNHEHC